mgnify:CR=1 FL=1
MRDTPVVLPAPDVQAALDRIYNQTVARTYVSAKGGSVMLSLAYGRVERGDLAHECVQLLLQCLISFRKAGPGLAKTGQTRPLLG